MLSAVLLSRAARSLGRLSSTSFQFTSEEGSHLTVKEGISYMPLLHYPHKLHDRLCLKSWPDQILIYLQLRLSSHHLKQNLQRFPTVESMEFEVLILPCIVSNAAVFSIRAVGFHLTATTLPKLLLFFTARSSKQVPQFHARHRQAPWLCLHCPPAQLSLHAAALQTALPRSLCPSTPTQEDDLKFSARNKDWAESKITIVILSLDSLCKGKICSIRKWTRLGHACKPYRIRHLWDGSCANAQSVEWYTGPICENDGVLGCVHSPSRSLHCSYIVVG